MSYSDQRMEVLYTKLYTKYNALKGKKFSKLLQIKNASENDIVEYITAADAYISQLRGENQKLLADIEELRNTARVGKDRDEDSQRLLSEVRQKNEELTKEIDRLLKLLEEGQNQNQEINTPQNTTARKRRRLSGGASDTVSAELARSDIHHSKVSVPSAPVSEENICDVDHQEAQCCRGSKDSAGSCNGPFQDLVECLTGMKVSVLRQSGGAGISALHQSSGYSFDLAWVKNAGSDDTELLYQVSSLGTFERIAPEWMRETIMFSMNMCPVFFERVSRLIKFAR